MFCHASSVKGIKTLEPRISNHGVPLIYFPQKRENVLVYLSNAAEKFCRGTGFVHSGVWHKWATYGFDKDCILTLDEYYPGALEETYKGVQGCIYSAESVNVCEDGINIPYAVTSREKVKVSHCEVVEDAYDEIMKAQERRLIRVTRYEQLSREKLKWICDTMKEEYRAAENHPEYRYFIEKKFGIMR